MESGSSFSLFQLKHKFYIFLVAAGFFVYFNSLFSPFVWDDVSQIQNNYFIQTLSNIPKFFLGSTFGQQNTTNLAGLYYRPLMTLLFSVIFSIGGLNTFYYHFLQVSIHVLNGILVFVLLKKFFKEKYAFFLALLFLVHPINVEAVSFISALGEPLFFLLGILALLISLPETISIKRAFAISILLLCSLFAKETGVLFIIMILGFRIIYKKKEIIKTSAFSILPLVLYLFVRFGVAKIPLLRLPEVPMMTASLSQRIFTMPSIFLFYLKTFFFPLELLISQQWSILQPSVIFYFSLVISICFILCILLFGKWVYQHKKHFFSPFLFFSLWFFIGLGFHLQILPLDFTVSDRWFYFPMVGLLGLLGIVTETIKYPSIRMQKILLFIIISLISLLALRTMLRNADWQSGISLYSANLQYQKNDDVIENALSVELMRQGDYKDAQIHFKNLLVRNPHEFALYVNLAETYEFTGDIPNAKRAYEKILTVDGSGIGYYNLARIILQKEGNPSKAKEVAEAGLKMYPLNATLWTVLAIADYQLGNQQNAVSEAKKANDIEPSPQTGNIYNAILNHQVN